jgi:hypothetical protein
MFELAEEHRMLQDLVAKFIDRDVIPLEKAVLAREMSGQKSSLSGGIRWRQPANGCAHRRI